MRQSYNKNIEPFDDRAQYKITRDPRLEQAIILLTAGYPTMRRVVRGLRQEDVPQTRMHYTWHENHMPAHWTNTIGMWGGVADAKSIEQVSQVPYNTFKMFRRRNGLQTPPRVLPQWRLAFNLFMKYMNYHIPNLDITALCVDFGVLPVEAKFYIDRMTYLASDLGVADMLDLTDVPPRIISEHWNDRYVLGVENAISQPYTNYTGAADDQAQEDHLEESSSGGDRVHEEAPTEDAELR